MNRSFAMTGAVLAGLLTPGLTTDAGAQGRPDTRDYSCRAINDIIRRNGAIVMSTGDFTFQRFVADQRYCGDRRRLAPQYIPSADSTRCVANFVCKDSFRTIR